MALLEPGDTVLGMSLAHGGHLTHGSHVSFSGKMYNAVQYGLNPETGVIDYEEVERLAKEHKPKMIIAGFSAYSQVVDWQRFRDIADAVGAYLMVDMAHVPVWLRRVNIRTRCKSPTSPPPPRTRLCVAREVV